EGAANLPSVNIQILHTRPDQVEDRRPTTVAQSLAMEASLAVTKKKIPVAHTKIVSSARALAGEQSFDVNWNDVELIAQPTAYSCWAPAGAMVVGWRDRVSLSPDTIASIAGRTTQLGLNPSDRQALANAIGLTAEPPQSYTIPGFRRMIENYGPLWVGI